MKCFRFLCLLLLILLLLGGCVLFPSPKGNVEDYEQKMKEYHEAADQKIAQLREAAEQGDVEAQYQIGYEYIRPLPIPRNNRASLGFVQGEGIKGIRWTRSGEQRIFVSLDQAEGIKWLRKAAEQGHVEAQYQLGCQGCFTFRSFHDVSGRFLYEENTLAPIEPAEGIAWLRKAAEQGHVEAQFALGNICQSGVFGTFEDRPEEGKAEAIKWFRKAAEQGHYQAPEYLRRMEETQ